MTEREINPNVKTFIDQLEKLNPGDRAKLKRNAGKTMSEARDALGLFYRLLPHGIQAHQESIYFLVATLFPLADSGGSGNLGSELFRAQSSKNEKGLDRRMEVLLDADASQLSYRLRRAIAYLRSCRVPVNWYQLLEDLLQWNHPDRYIQQRWARSYFVS
jgi:CRISPR system Cascade subunit CasB